MFLLHLSYQISRYLDIQISRYEPKVSKKVYPANQTASIETTRHFSWVFQIHSATQHFEEKNHKLIEVTKYIQYILVVVFVVVYPKRLQGRWVFSPIDCRSIDILSSSAGKDWSTPVDGLMMRRMSILHQNPGGIGKSIPDAREISRGFGKSLGRRGWISQYLPRFGGARIQSFFQEYPQVGSFWHFAICCTCVFCICICICICLCISSVFSKSGHLLCQSW